MFVYDQNQNFVENFNQNGNFSMILTKLKNFKNFHANRKFSTIMTKIQISEKKNGQHGVLCRKIPICVKVLKIVKFCKNYQKLWILVKFFKNFRFRYEFVRILIFI